MDEDFGGSANRQVALSAARLAHTPRDQSRDRFPPAQIWLDAKLQNGDCFQLNSIIFEFRGCAGWAEIPLLAHDLSGRLILARPSKRELLRPLILGLMETKLHPMHRQRFIEQD